MSTVIPALKGLAMALEVIKKEAESEAASERLAGNIVKEAQANGSMVAYTVVIAAINDTIATLQQNEAQKAHDIKSKDYLNLMAKTVKNHLPDNYGFLLLAAPFGEAAGRLVYTSSIERQSAICLVKEFLIKAGAEEDWMKHLE